jgi:hypothetical protein
MKTLYESLLDQTNKKVKRVKKSLMTLGGHYKLDCRITWFNPSTIKTMNKHRLLILASGKDFITKEFEKKFNAWEKDAKAGKKWNFSEREIEAVKRFMIWVDNLNIADLNISESIDEGMMVRNYSEPMAEFLNAKLREANIFDDWESAHFFTGTALSNGRGHYLIRGYTIQDPFELYISKK